MVRYENYSFPLIFGKRVEFRKQCEEDRCISASLVFAESQGGAVRGPLTARKFQCLEEERSSGYRYPAPEPITCHVLCASRSLPNKEPIPNRVFSVSFQPPELNFSQNHEFISSPKLPPIILRYSMSIFSNLPFFLCAGV